MFLDILILFPNQVSFLEETVCRTLSDKSILDPSLLTLELVAEIIRKSTNGNSFSQMATDFFFNFK